MSAIDKEVRALAVDVGSAVGYLDLDISGFLTGLKSAQSEADSASKNMAAKIGSAMQSVGDGMAKVGRFATAAITTPIVTAVTASVKQFANLEQSIGGVETLFKGSAQAVISSAETAYKRAGIDANNYMEQVTSFSATLLQSLGGDTKKAADYADRAVVDMSDNANKMGTNIGSIQEAYQGFAKQNYTMLDNLKLGYGGTQAEMERLIEDANKVKKANGEMGDLSINSFADVTEAIHIMQTELGITGTTAKEAEGTVSGSFGMMKSSVLNFLQQLGNPGADMKKFSQEMIGSVEIFVGNVKRVLATIWDNLPISPLQKKLLAAATAFGPVMLAGGKVVSIVGSITSGVNKAIPLINQFSTGFASAGTKLASDASLMTSFGAAIGASAGPILAVVAAIGTLAAAFATLWKTNEEFRNKITAIWNQIKGTFDKLCQGIVDRLNKLGFDFENIGEVLKAIWKGFCDFLAPIFEGVFQNIANTFDTIVNVILGVLDFFIAIFTGDWEGAWDAIKGIFESIWNGLVAWFQNIGNTLLGILDTICGWFGTTWDETWTNIKQFFVDIWNGIVSFFTNTIDAIKKSVSNFVTTIINFFAQLPTNIANFITNAYNSVVTWVSNMVTKAREMGQNFLNAVVEFFTNLPYKIGYFIGSALANVALWVVNMVNKAREMGQNFINNVVAFFAQLPDKILQFITNTWNNVTQWATDMVNKAREMGTNFINNVVSFFTQLPGKIHQFISSALNNVTTWVSNMASKARDAGSLFINNVVSFIRRLPGKIKQFLDSAINNLRAWVTQMGQKGTEAVQSLINNVISAASGIASRVMSIGSNIVSGVWSGIQNAASWFTSQVKSFFSGIVDGVKGALGIGSPSKVFRDEIGKWLPPGVAQGFKAALPAAMNSMEKDLNKGIDSIEPDDISMTATATAIGFKDTIKSIYDDLVGYFESVEARIGRSVNNMAVSLATLVQQGQMMVNSDSTLGYVGYGGFTNNPNSDKYTERDDFGKPKSGDGDTFIFNSPKAIDEIEAARQIKKTKQDMAEGF